uniref:CC domain-containing protein n=1 Tax=Onchocerca volvulus TaxID=6282 RepID=A0A8R1Y6S1_ONCVO
MMNIGMKITITFIVILAISTISKGGNRRGSKNSARTSKPSLSEFCFAPFNLCAKGYKCVMMRCVKDIQQHIAGEGPCINGTCPNGYVCREDNEYKKLKTVGPCVNSLCPFGYECKDNECIKNQIVLKNLASDESIGPCINNLCPENHTCHDELCYHTIKLINVS